VIRKDNKLSNVKCNKYAEKENPYD